MEFDIYSALADVPTKIAALTFAGTGFPLTTTAAHDTPGVSWIELKSECALASEFIDDKADTITKVVDLIGKMVANDLSELFAQGDTSSEDPFLAVMDGLRKRTSWPEAFVISSRIDAESDVDDDGNIHLVLTLYVSTIEP